MAWPADDHEDLARWADALIDDLARWVRSYERRPRYVGADRVLRAVYVWCAMASACRRTSQMTCDRHEDSAEPVWS